jgi:hypothetical protein
MTSWQQDVNSLVPAPCKPFNSSLIIKILR